MTLKKLLKKKLPIVKAHSPNMMVGPAGQQSMGGGAFSETDEQFEKFLSESLHIGTLRTLVGTKEAEYHRKKYLNPEVLKNHSFTLATSHEDIPKGTKIKGHRLTAHKGKYHLLVKHNGRFYSIPTNKFYKPRIAAHVGVWHEKIEDTAIKHIDKQIKSELHRTRRQNLHIKIGKKTYLVAGAKKVTKFEEGKPKADFILHDSSNRPVYFASHKKGPTRTNKFPFQQYGGTSEHSKVGNPVIAHFRKRLSRYVHPNKGPKRRGARFMMRLHPHNPHHVHLQKSAMFGLKYNRPEHGVDNVNSIIHGDMELVKHKTHYHIIAPKIVHNDKSFNPAEHPTGILAWRVGVVGRPVRYEGFKNTRVGIAPDNPARAAQTKYI